MEERLRLFIQVCRAVHTAHQNLIVHRDLKPGNILVTHDGTPKLLDFGIAKLLDNAPLPRTDLVTATGLAPMTPAYASPEQIANEAITTATDVYALGVLLYELLCGRRPHMAGDAGSSFDLLKAIREQEPTRPSHQVSQTAAPEGLDPKRLSRRLRGDLDHIVLQALAKEPKARYPSAERLADDIERHLAGLPVEANAAGLGYRLWKFVGRHRLAVAATALALTLLVGSLIALLVQRRATLDERDRAELTTRFLVDQFHDADPFAEAPPTTVRGLLDRSIERLDAMDAPGSVRADLQAAMGRAYMGLGEINLARGLLEKALEVELASRDHDASFNNLLLLAELEVDAGRPASGLARAEQALELADTDDRRIAALSRMKQAQQHLGNLKNAEQLLQEAFALLPTGPSRERAELMWSLGMLLHEDRRHLEAEAQLKPALALHQELWGDDHPKTARVLTSLGVLAGDLGEFDDSRRLLETAEKNLQDRLGSHHPERLAMLIHRARVEQLAGKSDGAVSLLSRAVELFREHSQGPDPLLANAMDQLGHLLQTQGRLDEAQTLLEQALTMRRALYGEQHPDIAESLEHIGLLYVKKGDDERAIVEFSRAYEIIGATLGPRHALRGVYLRHRGNSLLRQGRFHDALSILEQARAILEPRLGQANAQVGSLYNSLGHLHHRLDQFDAGRERYGNAISIMARAWGESHPRVGFYRNNLANLELEAGAPDAAWKQADAARGILDSSLAYEHPHRVGSDITSATCLIRLARYGEAEEILRRRLAQLDAQGAASHITRHILGLLIEAVEGRGGDPRSESARLATLDAP